MRLSLFSLRITLGIGLIAAVAAMGQRPAAQPAQKPAVPAADAAPRQALIDQYCVMCHSDALKTAGVVLEGLHIDHVGDNTATWERVLRKFGSGQMPPPGMPRPEDDTRRQNSLPGWKTS